MPGRILDERLRDIAVVNLDDFSQVDKVLNRGILCPNADPVPTNIHLRSSLPSVYGRSAAVPAARMMYGN